MPAQRVAAQYGVGAPLGPRTNQSPLESEFSASYQALALIAQVLESARNDLDDGVPMTAEALLSMLTRAKLAGDRLLRSRNG
jgi:hypothetical protein